MTQRSLPRALAEARGSRLGLVRLGSPVLGFAIQAVLTVFLGVDGLGQYAVVASVAAFVGIVVTVGLPASLSRELAVAESTGERDRLVWSSMGLALALWVVATVALVAVGEPLLRFFGLEPTAGNALLVAALTGGLALQALAVAIARGFDTLTLATLADLAINKVLLLVGLAAMAIGLVAREVGPALAVTAIAGFGPIMAVLYRLKARNGLSLDRPDFGRALTVVSGSWPLLFHQLVYAITTSVALWILSRSGDADATGIFHLVERLALMVGVPGIVIQFLFGVRLAQAIAADDVGSIEPVLRTAVARGTLVGAALAVLFIAVHPLLFWLVAGETFGLKSAVPLVILVIGQLFQVATGPCGYALIMGKREKLILGSTAVAAAVVTGLSFLLTGPYGAAGAALASVAGLVVVNVLNVWFSRRHLDLNTTATRATAALSG